MKKYVAMVVTGALMVFAFAGCAPQAQEATSSSTVSSSAASSSSSVAASSSSSVVQEKAEIKWTKVASAAEAAKGAGFDLFGVMDTIKIGDLEFSKPTFEYADGVAQATYETGAAGLFVRKADGAHKTPLTDRDKTEFPQTWSKSYEDLDVTMYGPAKGAATVITWADGTQEYGVTFQGLGGEELSMDSDDVDAIVKAIKEANTKKEEAQPAAQPAQEEEQPAQQEESQDGGNNPYSYEDVQNMVFENGLGEFVSAQLVEMNDGNWYWNVVTHDVNGIEHSYMVDPSGNIGNVDGDPSNQTQIDNPYSYEYVQQQVWNQGLGEFRSATLVDNGDGTGYWSVVTGDVNGNDVYWTLDANGNLVEAG